MRNLDPSILLDLARSAYIISHYVPGLWNAWYNTMAHLGICGDWLFTSYLPPIDLYRLDLYERVCGA